MIFKDKSINSGKVAKVVSKFEVFNTLFMIRYLTVAYKKPYEHCSFITSRNIKLAVPVINKVPQFYCYYFLINFIMGPLCYDQLELLIPRLIIPYLIKSI